MAETGINIKVTNTVLGSVPKVNANSMLFVVGASATNSVNNAVGFSLDTPIMIRSLSELEDYNITSSNNPRLYAHVEDFYHPTPFVDNTGTILWIVGLEDGDLTEVGNHVLATVENGFEFRPRNLLFALDADVGLTDWLDNSQESLTESLRVLYENGFSCVAVFGAFFEPSVNEIVHAVNTVGLNSPFAGWVVIKSNNSLTDDAAVGAVGGYMASLSVGTSIGDVSLPYFSESATLLDGTNCASLTLSEIRKLGDAQVIFARTRPPRNGLWLNDGATLADADTALSTLEAGRTIAAIVDDLREFFSAYINSRVPVASNGDIDPTYKQVVLDNARAKVITPYIESGDISDARIELVAKDNDMVGTRTWEVKLSILPAITLRWIDGFVFYVKSL